MRVENGHEIRRVRPHGTHAGVPHGELYANRLRMVEAYDRAGFYAYHLAEHHATPISTARPVFPRLGRTGDEASAPRPDGVLTAAESPLRVIEEICILDHLSHGRLDVGIGRGSSPFEYAFNKVDFDQSEAIFADAFRCLIEGLTHDRLTYTGSHYAFADVPMPLGPLQRPHPPMWYGVSIPDNADWPAANDVNIVSLSPRQTVRPIFDRYLSMRRKLGKDRSMLFGVGRHVVVADTDAQALDIARRAYPRWRSNFFWLFSTATTPRRALLACIRKTFDELQGTRNRRRRFAADSARFHQGRNRNHRTELLRALARLR